MHERAYTHVDHTRVCLGNAWFEREWSAMMGHTIRFLDNRDSFEWFTESSGEIALERDGETLGIMDLGSAEWSEEQCPQGASVIARYGSGPLVVTVRSMALHEQPALFRQATLTNASSESVRLEEVQVDILPVELALCNPVDVSLAVSPWEQAKGRALQRTGRHLLLAMEAPASLGIDNLAEHAYVACGPVTLEPNEEHALPELLVVVGSGAVSRSMARAFPEAGKDIKLWKRDLDKKASGSQDA